MSDPAIYIAVRCTTPHVPPRYTPPDHPEICFGIIPAVPLIMVRYSGSPIRHTDFGIRKSGFGNRGLWKSWCG